MPRPCPRRPGQGPPPGQSSTGLRAQVRRPAGRPGRQRGEGALPRRLGCLPRTRSRRGAMQQRSRPAVISGKLPSLRVGSGADSQVASSSRTSASSLNMTPGTPGGHLGGCGVPAEDARCSSAACPGAMAATSDLRCVGPLVGRCRQPWPMPLHKTFACTPRSSSEAGPAAAASAAALAGARHY
jgi:hypothetical protein